MTLNSRIPMPIARQPVAAMGIGCAEFASRGRRVPEDREILGVKPSNDLLGPVRRFGPDTRYKRLILEDLDMTHLDH